MIRFNEGEVSSEEQLSLGIKISRFGQMKIQWIRFWRTVFFSNPFLYLRKISLWVNISFLFVFLFTFRDVIFNNFTDNVQIYVFPALYNAQFYSYSLLYLSQVRIFLAALFLLNFIVFFLGYIVYTVQRYRIADVILLMLLLINLLSFKLLVQGMWLWNI